MSEHQRSPRGDLAARVGDPDDPTIRAAYRRFNPWFDFVPDARLGEAIVAGDPKACRDRVDEIRARLGIDLPVLDLSGLDLEATRRVMQALAPRGTPALPRELSGNSRCTDA